MGLLKMESAEMKQAKANIEQAENVLKENIFALGQRVYQENKANPESIYAEQIQMIMKLEANHRSFYQKKLQLEGMMMCENCDSIIPYGSAFCSVCGKNANVKDTETAAAADTGIICKKCGAALEQGAAFCQHCGCRVEG